MTKRDQAIERNNEGTKLWEAGKFDEAEKAYRKAIELDPKFAYPWSGLGVTLKKQERYDEAEKAYLKAIELGPKFATPWNGLGNALKNLERYDEAEKAYQRAIELNPGDQYAVPNLKTLHQEHPELLTPIKEKQEPKKPTPYEVALEKIEYARVSRDNVLKFNGYQLTTLPPEIGQLTTLTTLYLRDNQLTTIPTEIGQLTNLSTLNLKGNQLTTLPQEVGQLTNLTRLNLDFNQLTTIPTGIGQLTNLTTLNIIGNQLTTLPTEIGQLTNLTMLDLDGNPLPGAANYNSRENVQWFVNTLSTPPETPTTTFKVPNKLRTAFKQYLNYFNDFIKATKGEEIGLEVWSVEEGLELEIREKGGLDLDEIDDYLKDYLGFIKENVDQLNVEFQAGTEPMKKDLTMVELRGQVRFLQQSAEVKEVEIKYLKQMVSDRGRYLTGFSQSSTQVITLVQASSTAGAIATATATANNTLTLELPNLQEALDELRKADPKNPELEKAQDYLDKIPPTADKEKVIESGVMPKLKRIFEKGAEVGTKLEKAVKPLQKGGRAYNALAEWTGLPTIPRPLLGKPDTKKKEPK